MQSISSTVLLETISFTVSKYCYLFFLLPVVRDFGFGDIHSTSVGTRTFPCFLISCQIPLSNPGTTVRSRFTVVLLRNIVVDATAVVFKPEVKKRFGTLSTSIIFLKKNG